MKTKSYQYVLTAKISGMADDLYVIFHIFLWYFELSGICTSNEKLDIAILSLSIYNMVSLCVAFLKGNLLLNGFYYTPSEIQWNLSKADTYGH